uniref:Family with sequence similarity 169 member B n=1 Tax=Amphiprion percula TaxID=161767 RepID=A0A3P8SJH0_AMPPE
MFPADLPDVDETHLTSASGLYLSAVESEPETNQWFYSGHTSKVEIKAANIRQLQLFEDDQNPCVLLGLHPPDDPPQVVAVYLHDRWWSLDDALQTCSKSRNGLMSVESMAERVMVFLLSRLLDKPSAGEDLFRLHPRTESCKLLWRDGQALGFYSVKHKGSLCDTWSSCCYLLPVLDTLLVRRSCRRRGFGLQMVQDFCSMFPTEEFLGISSPLSASMVAVVKRFLQQHEEHRERLYEVEAPGGWTQRRNIWLNIQLGRYSIGPEEEESPTSAETRKNEPDESSQKQRSGSDHRARTASRAAEHTDQPDQRVPKGTQNQP